MFKKDFNKKDARLPEVNQNLQCSHWIPANKLYDDGTFCFLNLEKRFEKSIDWNFQEFGKLWTYNLNYFEFLLQPSMDKQTGLQLIQDFIEKYSSITDGFEPYPISLRTLNWIKFCLKHNINEPSVNKSLFVQLNILQSNLEYHLMGNHLMENGCALLIGGVYFDDAEILDTGKKILSGQLDEQILGDGGHFERSPMYHQILLHRLLDCYNILGAQSKDAGPLHQKIKTVAKQMLGWLSAITFCDGRIPCVNDTTEGIAPSTAQLNEYARRLGLDIPTVVPAESGYRMISTNDYEWFIDVGAIGPDYIPGHAHSDTFSFILHVRDNPLIVDTGISTYEECERRQTERSTASHNTVMVNETEQTEVWKAFRVGRRARITSLEEGDNHIVAEHDGYKYLGVIHRRAFQWNASELIIKDCVRGGEKTQSMAYLHFHPRVTVEKKDNHITADSATITFSGHESLQIKSYQYAAGFNQLEPSSVLEVPFSNKLETRIKI